jgi:hypothetical protein
LAKDPSSSGLDYVYAYTATGDESEDPAGVGLTVDLSDPAGNEAKGVDLKQPVVFDFTPPALKAPAVIAPSVAKAGTTVTIAFETTEALSGMPVVEAGGRILVGSALPGNNYEFGYKVADGEAEGERAVTISLSDRAGNALDDAPGGSFVVDLLTPQLGELKTSSRKYSARPGFNAVTLSFDCTEDVEGGLVATVGGAFMACGAWQATSPNYTCTYPVTGGEVEGTTEVAVAAIDKAGNIGFKTTAVDLDFSGPLLTLAVQPSGRPARFGELVTVGVAASEALDANGIAMDSGALSLGAPAGSGTSYTWTYTVKDGDNGIFNLSATATDVVGNPAAAPATGTIALDGVAPTIGNVMADKPRYSRVAGYNTVTVTFDCTEDVGPGLSARIGGQPMTCGAWQPQTPNYTCTYAIRAGDTDGVKPVEIKATDAAGNSAYGSGSVEYDFTSPTVLGAEPGKAAYRSAESVLYTVSVSEGLAGNPGRPVVRVLKDGVEQAGFFSTPVSETDTSFTYTKPTAGLADGTYTVLVDVTDRAGNGVTGVSGTGFSVDASIPAIATGPTLNKTPAFYRSGEAVTVAFTTSEDLDATLPKVTLNTGTPKAMPCTAGGGANDYTCSAMLDGTETQGLTGISIELSDAAGNTSYASANATLDFAAPGLVSAEPGQASYKLGDSILYTVSVSEGLWGSPGRPVARIFKGGVEQAGFFGTPVSETDTSFMYRRDVIGGMDGTYTVKVDLTDEAGNAASNLDADGFGVDAAAPVVTEQSLTTDNPNSNVLAKDGNVVTAVFATDENPPQNPSVALGGKAMTFVSKTGTGPFTFTYDRTATTADGDGLKGVTVTTSDLAGNVAVFSFASGVTYDFTAPSVGSASVRLIPATNCPLGSVAKVGIGATARVGFTVNEPLSADPAFSGLTGTWTVTKVSGSSPGLFYEYDFVLNAGAGDWSQVPKISLIDVAGNSGAPVDFPAATIPVDTTAPTAPDVNTQDRIVYKRVPWGFDEKRDGVFVPKTFRLVGGANAVDADTAWALAFDGPDPATAAEIGRKAAAGGTFGTMDLNRADRVDVYVAAYDTACNRSGVVKVKDVEWTATTGYKLPGSTFENPHLFAATPIFGPTLAQDPAVNLEPSAADLEKLRQTEVGAMVRLAEASWLERSPSGLKPSARQRHAMAYDASRGKVVLFGGNGGGQDTWEWNGASGVWTERTPAGAKPTARQYHALAYDAARGKVVLFGGYGGGNKKDTWEWDGGSGTWTDRTPAGTSPSGRYGHAMVYDFARGKVILFGGDSGGDETWEWDGVSGTWTKCTPTGAIPSARRQHAMAYDFPRDKVVLFGGNSGGDETWEWDGASGIWTERTPAGAKPSARFLHAMAFDVSGGKVVLFGGYDAAKTCSGGLSIYCQDTWEWDGATGAWMQRTPLGAKPSARQEHALVSDAARGKVVLFGGYTGSSKQDSWEWDGALGTWTERTPAGAKPTARVFHAMAFDASRAKTVLFGGTEGSTGVQDTWEWDGATGTWTDRTPAGVKPSARHRHRMAYDEARARVVLFGGYDNAKICSGGSSDYCGDTWEWDSASGTWTERTPAGAKPSARYLHAMAYDVARSKVMLFGGFDGEYKQDTWEWDGDTGTWTDRTSAGTKPPARNDHALAGDVARGKLVLFGGWNGSYPQGTWEWDGALGTWTERAPAGTAPSARGSHAMAYDVVRGRVVLFGGTEGGDETWEWDGALGTWTERTPSGTAPSARTGHAMTYDEVLAKVVLFGGNDGSTKQDVWEFDGGVTSRPGQVLEVSFAAAGVSTIPTWKSVASTFYSGGVGYPSSIATNGVDLQVWDEGQWKVVATNNSPSSTPTLVSWITTDPNVMWRLFFGDQQTLNFAVTPVAPNGTGTGEVAVDYAEVVVKYRMP